MQKIFSQWGKHVVAVAFFAALVIGFFSPAFFDGKVLRQGDNEKAIGMGQSQMKQYEETAQPEEFSVWSDAMFSGMPYIAKYGNAAPDLPGFKLIEKPFKSINYYIAGMVFIGLICFYILMCVMGVNWWLAIAGSIAFAFTSYNMIIIIAGHVVKAYVIAYMPLTLAGMALLFKRNYLWGGLVFLLGIAFSISNGHIQITYYLFLLCLFIYGGYVAMKIKERGYKELGIVTAIMVAGVILAVLPNTKKLYGDWELAQNSTRGKTELTTTTSEGEKISSGLDKEYAFQWSYGTKELLTLLIPNVYGGSSSGSLGKDTESYKTARSMGLQVGNEIQLPVYWGDKPFTEGPFYVGAVVCFLFVLGMFVIRNRMKWWLFAGALFLIFLSLGRNFDSFNDIMFHYLPFYNKFRTVEMALVIPGLVLPLIGMWGLKVFLSEKTDKEVLKKGLTGALSITGGLCLLIWLVPGLLLSFESNYDRLYQLPNELITALEIDRASLASADAFRSLVFILITAAGLFWFTKAKDKKKVATIVSIGVIILILADLWTIDKRYVNESRYMREQPEQLYQASVADKEILQDPSLSYRVLNLNNPFQETNTSYFHHSIGGYHAAKLRRYQELIDHRLGKELNAIINSLQQARTEEDLYGTFKETPSLNMLNARYIIYNPGQPALINPFAYGNAWFVNGVRIVANADEEIAALENLNPLTEAVVDQRFKEQLTGFTPQADSTAFIELTSYRPNRLEYQSEASSEQLAVFSEIYYQPGWKGYIDGVEVPHMRVDWTLRGLRVPAGKHQIVFEFYPDRYVKAAYIESISSFLILLLVLAGAGYSIWQYYRRNKEEKKTA